MSATFQNTAAQNGSAASPSSTQSVREPIDLTMYSSIRATGLKDPLALKYTSDLADGTGGRLTGSPNMKKAYSQLSRNWTRWNYQTFIRMIGANSAWAGSSATPGSECFHQIKILRITSRECIMPISTESDILFLRISNRPR
jgi:hypothetical protein